MSKTFGSNKRQFLKIFQKKVTRNKFSVFISFFSLVLLSIYAIKTSRLSAHWNNTKVYTSTTHFVKIDWHDWKFIEYEKTREGPGEQGLPFFLTDENDIKLNEEVFKHEGLYAIVSDKISVNRSIRDLRLPKCKQLQYLKHLTTTSVIIIYHNEYLSVLLRTVHSVYNRTPHKLLHEILLINDGSTKGELYEQLFTYVQQNFDERVKIHNLPERRGLIVARMEGVRKSKGEVLMFMDAHMEVETNWLPPLLEPIALNPRTSTVPITGSFAYDTFEVKKGGHGARGGFNWNFIFHWMPRRPEDLVHPELPSPTPIMLGGAFAIRRDYFLDLGGYDEQLMIWNGENYELSFKLWLTGGEILLVPCSRINHVFRMHNEWRYKSSDGFDFVTHNFKRIAEVWLDEYKECLYNREPEVFASVNEGDLTLQKKIRTNLNSKPFRYFLENVMPDMSEKFPCVEPGVFASGVIQSEADLEVCVDTFNSPDNMGLGLYTCHENLTHPESSQNFVFSWHRNIMSDNRFWHCLILGDDLFFHMCEYKFGTQLWFYNLTSKQIENPFFNVCLTANITDYKVNIKYCNPNDLNQKWKWGYTNETALKNWETFGAKLPDGLVDDLIYD